jgi:leucyl aminopeptidase
MTLTFLEPSAPNCDTYLLPIFQDSFEQQIQNSLLEECCKSIALTLLSRKQFTGKAGESFSFPTTKGDIKNVFLIGLGESKEDLDPQDVRNQAIKSCSTLSQLKTEKLNLHLQEQLNIEVSKAILEGLLLKNYHFEQYRAPEEEDKKVNLSQIEVMFSPNQSLEQELKKSQCQCENTNWARDLCNEPGNKLTPTILSERATAMANEYSLKSTILDEKKMAELGMGSLLSVSKGSEEEAKLIVVEYSHPKATKTIAFVGKGLTFDAGGTSLKPSAKMEQMRFDMCGAAAALGATRCLAELKPTVNIVCVVPSSENLPDGKANKPGDIVTAMNGLNIEVDNTDAEGRLILADALSYVVEKHQPDEIVDLATLTGAVIMCFSHAHAAILGNNENLATEIQQAGDQVHERVWPLPLLKEHKKWVKGRDADLNNTAASVEGAGTIKASAFLSHFVGETPWAHLDIAGTAWGPKAAEYTDGEHATGFGVRLLSQWIMKQYPSS